MVPLPKIAVGDSSITITLTSAMMDEYRRGDLELTVRKDGDKDRLILAREQATANLTIDRTMRKSSGGVSSNVKPARVSKQNVSSPQGVNRHDTPPPQGEGSAPTESPLRKKVRTRMSVLDLWNNDISTEDNLQKLSSEAQQAISSQSYLWREFAISNRLPGHERASDARKLALDANPEQRPSKDRKIQKALADRKVGKCLYTTKSTKVSQENSEEAAEEAKASAEDEEAAGVEGETSAEDKEQAPYGAIKKLNYLNAANSAPLTVEKKSTKATHVAPKGEDLVDSAKNRKGFLPPVRRVGGLGRKSGGRS